MKKSEGKITYDSIDGIVTAGFDAKMATSPSRLDAASDDLSGSWFLQKVVSAEKREGSGGFGKKIRHESAEKNQTCDFQDFNAEIESGIQHRLILILFFRSFFYGE